MKEVSLRKQAGRILLDVRAIIVGEDIDILISGGDKPHIGAVAVAQTVPCLHKDGNTVSISIITLPGHKDDVIARMAAQTVARTTGGNVVVSCGIHISGITEDEIETVIEISREMIDGLLDHLSEMKG